MASKLRIELYYDIVSPYSALAFAALKRYAPVWGCDLQLRPIFLGGIMAATGNKPPAMLPARGAMMFKDIVRNAKFFDYPMTMPKKFPGNTLRAMRLLTVVQHDAGAPSAATSDLTTALYRRHWGHGEDVSTPDALLTAIDDAGLSAFGSQWVAATEEPKWKDALKAATDAAVDLGMYGAPTMVVHCDGRDDELYFGSDRLEQLAFMHGLPWYGPTARPSARL